MSTPPDVPHTACAGASEADRLAAMERVMALLPSRRSAAPTGASPLVRDAVCLALAYVTGDAVRAVATRVPAERALRPADLVAYLEALPAFTPVRVEGAGLSCAAPAIWQRYGGDQFLAIGLSTRGHGDEELIGVGVLHGRLLHDMTRGGTSPVGPKGLTGFDVAIVLSAKAKS